MQAGQTISAVAARTGFTPSALRFYEDAGLIKPERTERGYRLYDERSVERLRFIARAKQLGLSLDEITELVGLWNGDQCAPVAARLQSLIEDKLSEAQRRIAEIVAFAGDLQRFRAGLATADASGACGDLCACQADSVDPTRVAVTSQSVHPADAPPIACTLAPDRVRDRLDRWRRVLGRATHGPTPVEGGVVVRFGADPGLAQEVTTLAVAEQSCCSFFAFTMRIDHTGTELTVAAPADARPLVEALFGATA
jgi:DNA-binding transcriptional MerR regulator